MRQVKNTVRHDPENGTFGDCHRACFCTILGLDPDQVPHFYEDGDQVAEPVQRERIERFLEGRGLLQGHVLFAGDTTSLSDVLRTTGVMMPGVPLILGGTSSIGCGHSVVLLDGEIFNDPTGSGIVGPMKDGYFWVTFFSPVPAAPISTGAERDAALARVAEVKSDLADMQDSRNRWMDAAQSACRERDAARGVLGNIGAMSYSDDPAVVANIARMAVDMAMKEWRNPAAFTSQPDAGIEALVEAWRELEWDPQKLETYRPYADLAQRTVAAITALRGPVGEAE